MASEVAYDGSVPATMKAVVAMSIRPSVAEAVAALEVNERPVPAPARGEVLVRVAAAACNPSDMMMLVGAYGASPKAAPLVPGLEGTGVVVATGGSRGRWLMGRRVAFTSRASGSGSWAEYCAVSARHVLPVRSDVPDEQAAGLIVNPLTAYAFLDELKRRKAAAFVHTAAASQLGRMLIAIAKARGIEGIHVVRRQEQVDLLKGLGAREVLNSESPGFASELAKAANRLSATLAFDAVGGQMTGALLQALPDASVVLAYGALSGQPCEGVSPIDLIFHGKCLEGFYLSRWIEEHGAFAVTRASREVQRLIAEGQMGTSIRKKIRLADIAAGLSDYVKSQATDGKVLIVP